MYRIHKLLSLPLPERWLLVKAATLLGVVRLMLWLLPFSSARRLFGWVCQDSQRLVTEPASTQRLAWAVSVASRFVPGASHCLTQAIATEILLVRRGYPAKVCFGVLPKATASLVAHAWVESNGVIVIGGADAEQRYVKLTSPMDSTS
jgi:hypothetical protein